MTPPPPPREKSRAATAARSSLACGSSARVSATSSCRASDERSKVCQALLRRRPFTPQAPLEQLAGDVPPAEPERQREREDEPAERDPERDEHHLLADPE